MLEQNTLAIIFAGLMALSVLLYAILDGYDLGVGMLLPTDNDNDADTMIASIGPFWDANETWLVLAVGLLLIAFPAAHNLVLNALYIPVVFLLIALIMRGVAFDFRTKAAFSHKPTWNRVFKYGSLLAALSQGYMLGMYVMSFDNSWYAYTFAILSAVGVCAAYCFIGAVWLVMKTESSLQQQSILWAKKSLVICSVGIGAVSLVNLLINRDIFQLWFTWPNGLFLLLLPLSCVLMFVLAYRQLNILMQEVNRKCWLPFVLAIGIFCISFIALAISYYPDIVPNKMTIWQAVSAPESLSFILWGALVVIPTIIAYTAFSYRVFWGKVRALQYY